MENVKKAGPETGQRDERNRNGHEILPKSRMTENFNKAGPETGQRDERNRNGHEILPKSRMRRMPKRPGLKRAREMNEIETGMRYCRKAE